MTYEIVLAGFGGQGILFLGKMIALAGMIDGKEVSWIPSYGPEMRGGTANCSVVVSDRRIGTPVVSHPNVLVAMNRPSLEKFEPKMQPGGLLLINKTLIEIPHTRTDIDVDLRRDHRAGRRARQPAPGEHRRARRADRPGRPRRPRARSSRR